MIAAIYARKSTDRPRGLSRSVGTKITGHRTEALYRRYAIVSDQDLQEAAAKLAVAHYRSRVPDRAGQ